MIKKLILTSFLLFSSYIIIYPSKVEKTNLFDFCYSLEKIVSRNSIDKSKNVSKKVKNFAKDVTLFGANKTKGALAKKIINQYKSSKKLFVINFVPNQLYCLSGYWIETLKPGTFASVLYQESKQRIKKYNDVKKGVDEFIKDINSEYESIKKELNSLF